jgi:hypothetical protein
MNLPGLARMACLLVLGCGMAPLPGSGQARRESLPPGATRCEPSIPVSIELIPLNQPAVGQTTRFRVVVASNLDPDLVHDMQLLYEVPARVRTTAQTGSSLRLSGKAGSTSLELGIILPDQARYPIRARLVVHLANGRTISQTAVRWVGLSAEDHPEGMLGRIVEPDGTGIRLYRGETIREPK